MTRQIISAAWIVSGVTISMAGVIRDHTPDGSLGGPFLFEFGLFIAVLATFIGIFK